ncbi:MULTISPECIES: hypothetical protein [Acidithrix]|nr:MULTISPECIES: hypothetical protein [Acidithrix]
MEKVIAVARASSKVAPSTFYDRWLDLGSWSDWDLDVEWATLVGPMIQGGVGEMKPKRGPKVSIKIESLELGSSFVNSSRLVGAKLIFGHFLLAREDGGSDIEVAVSLSGPMTWMWRRILAPGIRSNTKASLDRLVEMVEN